MDWQQALRARLKDAAPVAALVGQRVDWMTRPSATLPAITLHAITEQFEQHMTGFQAYQDARVQVDIWGADYASASDLATKVIEALVPRATVEGIRFDRATVEGVNNLEERDAGTTVYRKAVDLIIKHSPA